MVKSIVAFILTVGLVGGGLWLSSGLDGLQIWLFGAGLIGLVGIAAESFLDQPSAEPRNHLQTITLWVAPALVVVGGVWLAGVTPRESLMVVASAVAALTGVLLLGLKASLNPDDRFYRSGRFVANLILYLTVFLLFALIYHTKERSLVTATSIGLIALLAALEVLRPAPGGHAPRWRLSVLAGLMVAETTWALNYWPVSGLVGGAMLLLAFYVFTGLLLAIQEGGLERRMLAEYGTVGVAGLLAIAWAMM